MYLQQKRKNAAVEFHPRLAVRRLVQRVLDLALRICRLAMLFYPAIKISTSIKVRCCGQCLAAMCARNVHTLQVILQPACGFAARCASEKCKRIYQVLATARCSFHLSTNSRRHPCLRAFAVAKNSHIFAGSVRTVQICVKSKIYQVLPRPCVRRPAHRPSLIKNLYMRKKNSRTRLCVWGGGICLRASRLKHE